MTLSPDFLRTLEPQIIAHMAAAKVPGLTLGILTDGHLSYARGFGTCSVETPELAVTPDTVFRIGSVTKPLTGTLIMWLVQAGKLTLDDIAVKYPTNMNGVCPVTYRQLLSHTAGINTSLHYTPQPVEDYQPYREDQPDDPFYQCDELAHFYSYSNTGINIAGLTPCENNPVIYAEIMHRHVFAPLGMSHTSFDPLTAATYRLAQSHILDESDPAKPAIVKRPMIDNPAEYPCGFAFSTVTDLARYVEMQLADGRLPDGSPYLTSELITEMRRDHALLYTSDQAAYGLTLRSNRGRSFIRYGHNGAIRKYGAWMTFAPDLNSGIVMLCNRAPNFWNSADSILSSIWDELERTSTRRTYTIPEPHLTTPPIVPFDWTKTPRYPQIGATIPYIGYECGLVELAGTLDQPIVKWQGTQFELIPTTDPSVYRAQVGTQVIDVAVLFHPNSSAGKGGIPEAVMLNGHLAHLWDWQSFENTNGNPEWAGVYVGDLDTLTIEIRDGQIWVFSMDDQTWTQYHTPLWENAFSSVNGTIYFDHDNPDLLIHQDAFTLYKQHIT